MFKRVLRVAFVFCLAFAEVKGTDILPSLISASNSKNSALIEKKVNRFVNELKNEKSHHSEVEFLHLLFNETHRKFLKVYKPYSGFSEIFEKGRYDCLTATSLLTVVLESFDFNFQIIETTSHVFIQVETEGGPILLESTDHANGFIQQPQEINQKIAAYKADNLAQYKLPVSIYKVIDTSELSGLLLFNQAIVAYNQKDWATSTYKILQASRIYISPRTSEFASNLVTAIVQSRYEEHIKRNLIRPLIPFVRQDLIASR
jgi:hypothetical protein